MTERNDAAFVAQALLEVGGRVDALLATRVGILQATRNSPQDAIAVQQNLKMHHDGPLDRSNALPILKRISPRARPFCKAACEVWDFVTMLLSQSTAAP